ncbi:hypothetical protein CALCODRAFT_59826 [Calocera cornea HHB12733]|uniref:Uncharacterized protein n=1 Tax=Calocera cornea HHB12733 TaxID=1353952 RepID=A0A165IXI2_9BASI|nr:hypothetical protein CALCODRAFT_59826 [Calocera cornea HHB12733]
METEPVKGGCIADAECIAMSYIARTACGRYGARITSSPSAEEPRASAISRASPHRHPRPARADPGSARRSLLPSGAYRSDARRRKRRSPGSEADASSPAWAHGRSFRAPGFWTGRQVCLANDFLIAARPARFFAHARAWWVLGKQPSARSGRLFFRTVPSLRSLGCIQ